MCAKVCATRRCRNESASWISCQKKRSRQECEADMVGARHYTDPVTGMRHDRQRRAENKVDAGDLVHELLAEVDATGERSLAKDHMTFFDLATYFEKQYLKPAEYVDGRKVAGVRSLSPAIAAVNTLKEHFGKRQLRGITHAAIRDFRAERLAKPTKAKKQRSIAAVNPEL